MKIPSYDGTKLEISSIKLGTDVNDRDLDSKPIVTSLPTRQVRQGQTVYGYFEIYGLKPSSTDSSQCRIEITANRLKPGRKPKVLESKLIRSKELRGTAADSWELVELDTSEWESGRWILAIKVTDLIGRKEATTETAIVVAGAR